MYRLAISALALLLILRSPGAQTEAPEQVLRRAITLHQGGDIDAAILAYREYLKLQPDSLIALSNLGAAYARAGRYEEAIAQYQRALERQPGNGPVELNLAVAYYKTGEAEQAAAILEEIHKASPDELPPTFMLADCWLAMGKNQS